MVLLELRIQSYNYKKVKRHCSCSGWKKWLYQLSVPPPHLCWRLSIWGQLSRLSCTACNSRARKPNANFINFDITFHNPIIVVVRTNVWSQLFWNVTRFRFLPLTRLSLNLGTVARRWRWVMQSTSPTANTITTRMALGTLYHPTTIIPDSEPHDQSLDLSADLFPGEPAPSWSSYFYYCTILWW